MGFLIGLLLIKTTMTDKSDSSFKHYEIGAFLESCCEVMDYLHLGKCLGAGQFGSVYRAIDSRNGKEYALKIVNALSKSSENTLSLMDEVRIMATLEHPHILRYHQWNYDWKNHKLRILFDYCKGGTLQDQIYLAKSRGSSLAECQIMNWFVQICIGLSYLHSRRILHRDIKPSNVFLTSENIIKLGDFGLAKQLENDRDGASSVRGTPCYLSPEVCQEFAYNTKSDIWALGCVLHELCVLQPAFHAESMSALFQSIIFGECSSIPEDYSKAVRRLVRKLLSRHADNRPSALELLARPYVRVHLDRFIEQQEVLEVCQAERHVFETRTPNIFRSQKSDRSGCKSGRLQRYPSTPEAGYFRRGADLHDLMRDDGARSASPNLVTSPTEPKGPPQDPLLCPSPSTPHRSFRELSLHKQRTLSPSRQGSPYLVLPVDRLKRQRQFQSADSEFSNDSSLVGSPDEPEIQMLTVPTRHRSLSKSASRCSTSSSELSLFGSSLSGWGSVIATAKWTREVSDMARRHSGLRRLPSVNEAQFSRVEEDYRRKSTDVLPGFY